MFYSLLSIEICLFLTSLADIENCEYFYGISHLFIAFADVFIFVGIFYYGMNLGTRVNLINLNLLNNYFLV